MNGLTVNNAKLTCNLCNKEDSQFEDELIATKLAQKVLNALPLEANWNKWGDEIYFATSIEHSIENGQEVVEVFGKLKGIYLN